MQWYGEGYFCGLLYIEFYLGMLKKCFAFVFFTLQFSLFGQSEETKTVVNPTIDSSQVKNNSDYLPEHLVTPDSIHIDTLVDSADQDNSDNFFSKIASAVDWGNLPYIFDDIMIVTGLNLSTLNFSNFYREIGTVGGWQIGAEGYYPISPKAFFQAGLLYSRTGFMHNTYDVRINNHQIVLPFNFAYELPVFRSFDWRFFLGGQVLYNAGFSQIGDYPEGDDFFRYNPNEMTRFDLGLNFGLSFERDSYYFRLRGYTGTFKVTSGLFPGENSSDNPRGGIGETGMMQAYFIEFGYFLFRSMRRF